MPFLRAPRPKKKVKPETLIQNAIRQYLGYQGWLVFRHQQGLGSMPGFPDLTAIKDGVTIYVEVKAPKGRLSDYQNAMRHNITVAGGLYIVARSVEDVIETTQRMALVFPDKGGQPAQCMKPVKGMRWEVR